MPPRGRPKLAPDLVRTNVFLGTADRKRAARIAAELTRRTGAAGSLAAAVRWALAELDGRIGLERKAKGQACLTPPGPMVPPPGP